MYIEFSLPRGAGGMSANHADYRISQALRVWSEQYQIPYRSKHVKYFSRITFDDDAHYAFFVMTWNPTHKTNLSKWRIVSDLNNKNTFDSAV